MKPEISDILNLENCIRKIRHQVVFSATSSGYAGSTELPETHAATLGGGGSSTKERRVDALALRADEGRDKLR